MTIPMEFCVENLLTVHMQVVHRMHDDQTLPLQESRVWPARLVIEPGTHPLNFIPILSPIP